MKPSQPRLPRVTIACEELFENRGPSVLRVLKCFVFGSTETFSQHSPRYFLVPGESAANASLVASGLRRFVHFAIKFMNSHQTEPLLSVPPPPVKQNLVWQLPRRRCCAQWQGEAHKGIWREEKEKPDTGLVCPGSKEVTPPP